MIVRLTGVRHSGKRHVNVKHSQARRGFAGKPIGCMMCDKEQEPGLPDQRAINLILCRF